MKIIINEIKKIFNLKMITLLIIGSAIFYQLFISFEIEFFPNGRPKLDIYNIMVQMIDNYGHEMDEIEFQNFKNIYEKKLIEANNFLNTNKDFNAVGVYSYEDFLNEDSKVFSEEGNEKFENVKCDYLNKEEGTIFWELQEFPNLIAFYEDRDDYYSVSLDEEKYKQRINEIISNDENEAILPNIVFGNYNNIIMYVGLGIVIGIAFMLTPIFLRDKKDKLNYLQYSSKHGRKLFKSKLIAGIISALIITTIELVIYFVLYNGNNTTMFFESNINSVFNNSFWFNITFIQYIILTVVGIYIISTITAFVSMFISNKVNNYISSIGIQVPTLFIIGGLTVGILLNNLFILYMPKYLALVIYLTLAIIAVIITKNSIKKERIVDVNN